MSNLSQPRRLLIDVKLRGKGESFRRDVGSTWLGWRRSKQALIYRKGIHLISKQRRIYTGLRLGLSFFVLNSGFCFYSDNTAGIKYFSDIECRMNKSSTDGTE